jgi:hypothetical protein
MPAGSDVSGSGNAGDLALPHTWRPFGARVAGVVFGGALLVVCAFAWFSFDAETRAKFTGFQRGTLVFLGMIAFAAWFALVRSRVVAEPDRLVVVNGYRRRELDWAEIVAVHLPPGAPWVTLDLSDGTTMSALGIQGSDGARARTAVRQLRALVDR